MGMSEIIKKIKTYLSEEAQEITLTDVKTQDGIILSFDGDELSVGVEIYTVDESGRNPAMDGDYKLEDGTTIVVVESKVAEIKPAEEPIEGPDNEPEIEVEVKPEVEMSGSTCMSVEELQAKVTKLEQDSKKIFEILTQLTESLSKDELEKEIKTEMKKVELTKFVSEKSEKSVNRINKQLDNIFENMYKNYKP
jgi:hypothetical protein